jgi:amino acid permease
MTMTNQTNKAIVHRYAGIPDALGAVWRRTARIELTRRLEQLPPFWIVFALTLTETVGGNILAMPIALASVGPLAGLALLVVIGAVHILTIAALAEAITRNGSVRTGHAYFGRIVADYLGTIGSSVLTLVLLIIAVLGLVGYYIGVATTLAGAIGARPEVWAAVLFLVGCYFLRRKSLNLTIATALLIGLINISMILVLSFLTLPHVRIANLLSLDQVIFGGRPFNPAMLALGMGTVVGAYLGHMSTATCARLVLKRDPSGKALVRGNIAARATALLLYALWTLAVNGTVAPSALLGQPGTALTPLAAQVGPAISVFGLVYVVLAMGMGSIHFSLALFNQMLEWLPERPRRTIGRQPSWTSRLGYVRTVATSGGGRFLLAIAPVVVIFCSTEWLLLTGRESFTGLVAFVGAIMSPVLGGIFPMLLLAASRRTGEYVPGRPLRFVSHPIVIAAIYLLFVLNIFLHGLVIWQNPVQRASALIVGVIVLVVPIICLRRGAFSPCAVVEWRTDQNDRARPMFTMTVNGQPAPADVWLRYEDGTQHRMAASGEVQDVRALLSATVDLGTIRVRNVKVWVRRITTTGDAECLVAPVEVTIGHETRQFDLSGCEWPMVLPVSCGPCRIRVTFWTELPNVQRRLP